QNLYTDFLNAGNKALEGKLYNQAKDAYNEALKIKPNDAYVIEKLNLTEKQKAQDEIEVEYSNYINSGNKAFNDKSYDEAKIAYNEALKTKPNDVYATNQIQKIDNALASSQVKKELNLQKDKEEKTDEERPDIKAAREIDYNMTKIKEHKFKMGNDVGATDESPVHIVAIDPFYIGKYEVTQSQWQRIMGSNPSVFKNCDGRPVENISWDDAMEFIQKLNAITNKKYRLPTESEWEFVARSQSVKEKLDNIAWYNDNSKGSTHPVGQLRPNPLGIYDMLGNVSEWCSDWYNSGFYSEKSSSNNPMGPASGRGKVTRGGCWYDIGLRVTERDKKSKTERSKKIGLRLALSIN
ncbi:MAG: SUMF1/EgtB/PvdO family nonheme iron enzyme, partial [Ginsengibacter sp.]